MIRQVVPAYGIGWRGRLFLQLASKASNTSRAGAELGQNRSCAFSAGAQQDNADK
jgi:hypothetical protein